MKIRALRVREVGILRDAVALEGLGGGLDVLAGPNELGKSTLFRALDAVFRAEHKTTKSDLKKQLVPYSGGAPIIEVDFELAGARYRLRKRYFSAPKASLTGLDDGSVFRGADAEARLAELMAKAGGAGRLDMLWVEQSRSLETFAVDGGTAAGLKGLIERELAVATGGGNVHGVREKIRARLEALVTGGRRQPRGSYKDTIDLEAGLRREHEALTQKAAQGSAGLDRLATLRESQAALTDPAAATQRAQSIAGARAALETARAAADKRHAAEEAWKRHEQSRLAAAAALADFDRRAKEFAANSTQKGQALAALASSTAQRDAAQDLHKSAADDLATHEAAERDLALRLDEARRQASAAGALAGLRKRLAEASALMAQAAELRQLLAADRATPDLAHAADAAGRAVETLEAKLAAVSVRVTVAYERGADGKISRAGAPVPAGTEHVFVEPVELVVAGVGRIKIAPGDVAAQAEARADLTRRQRELGELLARAGAADVAALREAAVRRGEAATALGRADARLGGICPEGVAALQAEVDRLAAEQTAAAGDPAAIELELKAAQGRRKAAAAAHALALAAAQKLDLALTRQEAEAKALEQRHLALSAALPPADTADAHRRKLDAEAIAAAERAREAVLLLDALRQQEPDERRLAALNAELAGAIKTDADIVAKTNVQAREMAALEAELRRDALDGIGERLAECEGDLALATRNLAALVAEVAALTMLDDEFERAEADTRAHYLGPVISRLAPYLQTVLPGAALQLGESFGAEALQRREFAEPVGQLSHGTREQIAVLVRLGLARLLADTGEPLPLILDDALVYADDERIAASFAALRLAAERHQVIVLTCRAKSFAALGGTRLALRAWQNFSE